MMRLPWFEYRAPSTLAEAARILAGEGPNAMLIAPPRISHQRA